MVTLDEAVVARYETHGHRFEVLVDPDVAYALRSGERKELTLDDLVIDKVFKDARKGDVAGESLVQETFGSTEILNVAMQVIRKGEMALTTDQRRKLVEQARKAIIATIARNAVDPRSHAPHPPQRIERALEEARFHVDPFKPHEEQVKVAVKAIQPLLPLKFERVRLRIRIPAQYVGGAYHVARGAGDVLSEKWNADGSWEGKVEVPAGIQTDLFDELNRRTHGHVEATVERA